MPKSSTNQVTTTAPKGIPLEKIIKLRSKGLSLKEVANVLGCSEANISLRLKDHLDDLDALDDFKQVRGDTLALYQRKLINSLNTGDIQKASPYQRVGMFGILYDKERLERGQTTENIGYMDYNQALDQVMRERERLQDELGIDGDTIDVGDVSD